MDKCRVNGCKNWYSDYGAEDQLCENHYSTFRSSTLAIIAINTFQKRVGNQHFGKHLVTVNWTYLIRQGMFSSPEWHIAIDQWLETL